MSATIVGMSALASCVSPRALGVGAATGSVDRDPAILCNPQQSSTRGSFAKPRGLSR
jgi:hypothetical protein